MAIRPPDCRKVQQQMKEKVSSPFVADDDLQSSCWRSSSTATTGSRLCLEDAARLLQVVFLRTPQSTHMNQFGGAGLAKRRSEDLCGFHEAPEAAQELNFIATTSKLNPD